MPLQIRETYVNETKGHQFGSTEWYEPFTEDRGDLYRSLQSEYGRCVSKVYVDLKSGAVKTCGWVFHKRMEYEDYRGSGERFYLREVWVEVRERPRE